jgi:hypothetical protein
MGESVGETVGTTPQPPLDRVNRASSSGSRPKSGSAKRPGSESMFDQAVAILETAQAAYLNRALCFRRGRILSKA